MWRIQPSTSSFFNWNSNAVTSDVQNWSNCPPLVKLIGKFEKILRKGNRANSFFMIKIRLKISTSDQLNTVCPTKMLQSYSLSY